MENLGWCATFHESQTDAWLSFSYIFAQITNISTSCVISLVLARHVVILGQDRLTHRCLTCVGSISCECCHCRCHCHCHSFEVFSVLRNVFFYCLAVLLCCSLFLSFSRSHFFFLSIHLFKKLSFSMCHLLFLLTNSSSYYQTVMQMSCSCQTLETWRVWAYCALWIAVFGTNQVRCTGVECRITRRQLGIGHRCKTLSCLCHSLPVRHASWVICPCCSGNVQESSLVWVQFHRTSNFLARREQWLRCGLFQK